MISGNTHTLSLSKKKNKREKKKHLIRKKKDGPIASVCLAVAEGPDLTAPRATIAIPGARPSDTRATAKPAATLRHLLQIETAIIHHM